MLSINRIMVTGRLTRDPETRYLASGQAVTKMGVAVNRRFQDKNGEWRDETMFLDVETWGKTAERCAETLQKGRPVYVEGRLKCDTWERDGVKQTKFLVVAERVSGFDVPKGAGGDQSSGDADYGDAGGPPPQGSGMRSESANPGPAASAPRPAQNQGATPFQRTGAPSDNLEFNAQQNVQDDIPF